MTVWGEAIERGKNLLECTKFGRFYRHTRPHSTLDIRPILPFNKIVGIMHESKSHQFHGSIPFKCRFTVTVGKGLLNAQMVNVEWIVSRIVRRSLRMKEQRNVVISKQLVTGDKIPIHKHCNK